MRLDMEAINPKARCFVLTNGDVLVTSPLTWEDLPLPKPLQLHWADDWRYQQDAERIGPVLARHFWRQREGRSAYGSVHQHLQPVYAAMWQQFPRWKRWLWWATDWFTGV